VPFPQLPVVAAMHPPVSNPVRAVMRPAIVVARMPYVLAVDVVMIAPDPLVIGPWRWSRMLDDWSRWSYANHNLRIRHRRHQCESKQ